MGLFDIFKKNKDEESFASQYLNNKTDNGFDNFDEISNDDNFDNAFDGIAFCMYIEDMFSISKRGTVVTGQISSGDIHVGEFVKLIRDGKIICTIQIIGIEQFRKVKSYARQGENVGLLIKDVPKEVFQRGDKLAK